MQHNSKVLPIEIIISLLSYFSMGIVGFIWVAIAYITKKKLRYFLFYNIVQSMLISIILALFKHLLDLILSLISIIPFLDKVAAIFNWFISIKVISISYFSFSIFELLLTILLCYISVGVILGRIFYIPALTRLIKRLLAHYE